MTVVFMTVVVPALPIFTIMAVIMVMVRMLVFVGIFFFVIVLMLFLLTFWQHGWSEHFVNGDA